MADDKLTETELDVLFETAQRRQPAPSQAWFDQVAADAARTHAPRRAVAGPSLWDQILSALGGRSGLGGMVAASAVGLWLGFAPPALIGDPVGIALGSTETLEVFAEGGFDYATLLDEG